MLLIVALAPVAPVRSPEGKLTLYCKGADTIVFERLHPSCRKLKEATTSHLNVSEAFVRSSACCCETLPALPPPQEYAGDGLRTLALAYKHLDSDYLEAWKQRHHDASIALDEREEKLDELYEEIEKDLLVGMADGAEGQEVPSAHDRRRFGPVYFERPVFSCWASRRWRTSCRTESRRPSNNWLKRI